MPDSEPTTTEEAITEAALGPRSAEVDGQKVESHRLTDLIEADRYLRSLSATQGKTKSPLRFGRYAGSSPVGGSS